MELENLEGNIIGVISKSLKPTKTLNKLVGELIPFKTTEALQMVGLPLEIKEKQLADLSSRDKNKVILASKLQDKTIILYDFSKGMLKKDLDNFKRLFKKIVSYNRKIILVDNNPELFINCVDKIYVIENNEIEYLTDDLFDVALYKTKKIDPPEIVRFIYLCKEEGVNLSHYTEIDELIKAIYRIKS